MSLHDVVRRRAALVLLAMLPACHWGGDPKKFAPALTPAGASVAVRVRGETTDRAGELYAADTAGVVIRGPRLVRIRWQRVAAIDVDRLGKGYDVRPDMPVVDAPHRARLAAVSRFPQGLSGSLLERVLSLIGQPALDEVP
jgi:hypothetical protein